MRIVFADVDGVFRHSKQIERDEKGSLSEETMDRSKIGLLNRLMTMSRDTEHTEIVVSSCLRVLHELPALRKIFRNAGLSYDIYDVTPYGPAPGWKTRGGEIHRWLLEQPSVTSFAIIDDEISDMDRLTPWTVHVSNGYFQGGMKGYHVRQALNLLAFPLNSTYAEAYASNFPRQHRNESGTP